MSEIRLDGRVAVVTGAGGGLGRAHALLLAARGAKVVVNDLGVAVDGTGASSSPAEKVVEEIRAAGGEAVANPDPVDTAEGGERIVKTALEAFGKLDVVVCNAGILRDRTLVKLTEEEWRRVLEVHLNGTYFVTRAAVPVLRDNNYGRIVFTTSAAGLWGNFGQSNYAAAKLGIVGFMNAVKLETMKYNILVNTVAPIAASRMMATVMPPQAMEKLDPRHVAAMVCLLCSERNRFNGGIFAAGGGHFARAAMIESAGVNLAPDAISPETVAENFDAICDMTGAKEYRDATLNLQKTLAAVFKPQ